jgi:hypothetical protein
MSHEDRDLHGHDKREYSSSSGKARKKSFEMCIIEADGTITDIALHEEILGEDLRDAVLRHKREASDSSS